MAKIKLPQDVSNVESWEELRRFAASCFNAIVSECNGRLGLQDNLQTGTLEFNIAAAGQEVGVGHGLGFVPNGFIPIKNSTGAVLFNGSTENTKDTIYFRATGAGAFKALVF